MRSAPGRFAVIDDALGILASLPVLGEEEANVSGKAFFGPQGYVGE